MVRYAITIFFGAFLLFQVQPLIGKYILPWFGGTPAVWTTCMLFFQWLLLAGYAYAHFVGDRLSPRRQAALHITLLVVSLAFLPIVPNAAWRPLEAEFPIARILALLLFTIGVPYFLLSTTGPLLQRWFSGTSPDKSPYRLYALSNAGSLLALVTYPFVFEPALTLGDQARLWSVAYVVFAACCGWCAWQLAKQGESVEKAWRAAKIEAPSDGETSPQKLPVFYWLALSATGSILLLATTNQMCQEVAVVPFLWILPLALYLLSFVICFDSPRWYWRSVFGPALAVGIIVSCLAMEAGPTIPLWQQIGAYALLVFAGCMTCHGELVRARPDPRHLTLFYLVIAIGGALGGMVVAVIAPALFKGYWEFHLALFATAVLALVGYSRDRQSVLYGTRPILVWLGLWAAVFVLAVYLGKNIYAVESDSLATARNFYGVLRVRNYTDDDVQPPRVVRALVHGRIMHGQQFLEGQLRFRPTSYYGPDSGVGIAINEHPRRVEAHKTGPEFRIGVIGLGAGTLAAHAQSDESITFYEINPEVVTMANDWYTYLKDCPADKEIVLGDARTQMEQQLREDQLQKFDVLAVDAFSSDAIPMHLLTTEAFDIYRKHLRDDGLLVLHVSSHHVNLNPVVLGLAKHLGWEVVIIDGEENPERGENRSEWLIVTQNRAFLDLPVVQLSATPWPDDVKPIVWTDDFASLWQVLGK